LTAQTPLPAYVQQSMSPVEMGTRWPVEEKQELHTPQVPGTVITTAVINAVGCDQRCRL